MIELARFTKNRSMNPSMNLVKIGPNYFNLDLLASIQPVAGGSC